MKCPPKPAPLETKAKKTEEEGEAMRLIKPLRQTKGQGGIFAKAKKRDRLPSR